MKVRLFHHDAGDVSVELNGRPVGTFVDHDELENLLNKLVGTVIEACAKACDERQADHEEAIERGCGTFSALPAVMREAEKCGRAVRALMKT